MSKKCGFFCFLFCSQAFYTDLLRPKIKTGKTISKVMTLRNIDCYGNTASSSVIQCSSQYINDEVLFRSLNSASICFSSSLFILKNVLDFNTTSSSCYNTNRISAFSTHISSLFMGICTHFHIFRLSQETIMIIYHGNL